MINIIFVSDNKDKCYEAIQERVSGYLVAPFSKEDIRWELDHLRHGKMMKPYIKCFGKFNIFVDGKAAPVKRKKCNELFAYLVLRKGEIVSPGEVAQVILGADNERTRNNIFVIKHDLMKTLTENGLRYLFEEVGREYRVKLEDIDCDFYDYLDGDEELYQGEFMNGFDWAKPIFEKDYMLKRNLYNGFFDE